METVKCYCGGNAIAEFRQDMIFISCDRCKNWVASIPDCGESKREQMERTVQRWNKEQEGKRKEANRMKVCPLKYDSHKSIVLNCGTEEEVEIDGALCDGPLCAWWIAERECCGICWRENIK